MINGKWADVRGGNVLPSSSQDTSENPSLYNAVYYFLLEDAGELTEKDSNMLAWLNYQKWSTNKDRYMTNAFDVLGIDAAKKNGHRSPDRFSLDEVIAVAAGSKRFGHHANLRKIELFGRSYSLRPDTFWFLAMCKYPFLVGVYSSSLPCLIFLAMTELGVFNVWLYLLISILNNPRAIVSLSMIIACMRKPQDTSGKQLTYVRYKGLNMKWTFYICTKILTNKSWAEVFQIYFPERDHPINTLARKVFNK